jgi:hypothetical protein
MAMNSSMVSKTKIIDFPNKKRMEGWQPMDGMVDVCQDALLTSHPM